MNRELNKGFDANKIEYCSIYMPPGLKFSGYNKLIDCIRILRQCVYYDTKCVYYDTNMFLPFIPLDVHKNLLKTT
jgi:hypothetical protein